MIYCVLGGSTVLDSLHDRGIVAKVSQLERERERVFIRHNGSLPEMYNAHQCRRPNNKKENAVARLQMMVQRVPHLKFLQC